MYMIADFLASPDELVRARAAGCVHNISADPVSLAILRETGCIPHLLSLLRDHSPEVCQAAAGSLQNLSREAASREIIIEADATPLLLDLLFSADVKCQVGRIWNYLWVLVCTMNYSWCTSSH
jgi:vesicle coat complex subunit